MRHIPMAVVALAPPAAAEPPHGSAQYQRTVRCAGVAMAMMVFAVEVETTGETLEHDGMRVGFDAPETYQKAGNIWLGAAISLGEFDGPIVRRDLAEQSGQIGAQVDRAGDRAREIATVIKEFAACP